MYSPSNNFRHRFTEETVDQVFRWILEEVAEAGYLSPKAVFIDGTHIKANANTKKQVKAQVPAASKHYAKELMEEVNADREAHGKKPFDDDDEPPTPTNKRPQTLKGGHQWWKYVYDEHYDCVLCPEYQVLTYRTTNRDGYREYRSDPKICASCPSRHLCTHSKDCVKTVQRHIWKDYEELADDARYTPKYKDLYKRRKETIERVFADAKEKHAMRYTQYRGLTQVTNWVKLKFAAMNLKKLARWLWMENSPSFLSRLFLLLYAGNPACSYR